ncbi:MAG: SOS response-associated peptidase [Cyclobacteriaceae bacterium]
MYDRLTIGTSISDIEKRFEAKMEESFTATYNAAPSQKLPVITTEKPSTIQLFYWGIIPTLSNNKAVSPRLINLPAETALSKPMYKKALKSNRCLILSDGFYGWKQVSKKQKTPYFISPSDGIPFAIAGLWEEYEDFEGRVSKTFNMITQPASEPLDSIQHDSPLLLNKQSSDIWLSNDSNEDNIRTILEKYHHFTLNYHPVSPLINNLKIYDQRLIEPTQPSDQHGNYTLF